MAAEIPNLVKRNKIYYFRCRIPSNLTNGRAREVKISLKTGNLTSDLLDVILHIHLQELMDMELVILESGKKNTVQTYKLLYDGNLKQRKFFLGLKTAETVDTAENQ